jgi:deoxyribodipyrimidine photo-lyase
LIHLWWIRRDLRLEDNQALASALRGGARVVPVFILDERLLARKAEKRQAFLFAGLRAFEADLRRLGSGLILRRGDPAIELLRLVTETGAQAVFAEEDITPFARRRDAYVAQLVDLRLTAGLGVHPASAVRRGDGGIYTVFTPYSRAWKSLPFSEASLPAPSALPPLPEVASAPLPDLSAPCHFPAGEQEAQRRLQVFLDGPIFQYADGRNRLDLAGTSTLSPYLRFGMLSARKAVVAARQVSREAPDIPSRGGCETFLNELIWREFYQSILYHFPYVLETSFNPTLRSIPWQNDPQALRAWQSGQTGYPVVDAAMRQLAETGWMHNRARMITASFLTKHLLVNWQEGECWFMRHLVDGDPAANNGGWQWTAGTGTDAAPYFRVFNPILQGQKFDPEGSYVRHWVPELTAVPVKYIHSPWEMTEAEQRACGVRIGRDYPVPLVEHDHARKRALAAYAASRQAG